MTPRLLAPLLVLLAILPFAGAAGPFQGSVRQGESDAYAFGDGGGDVCDPIIEAHTATLSYSPATDVLSLSAGRVTVQGVAGRATLTFLVPSCPGFTVRVGGTLVAGEASYTLTLDG
jgi:hypothetical protein